MPGRAPAWNKSGLFERAEPKFHPRHRWCYGESVAAMRGPTYTLACACASSSAGRAAGLHPAGRRFEPVGAHHFFCLQGSHTIRGYSRNKTTTRGKRGTNQRSLRQHLRQGLGQSLPRVDIAVPFRGKDAAMRGRGVREEAQAEAFEQAQDIGVFVE